MIRIKFNLIFILSGLQDNILVQEMTDKMRRIKSYFTNSRLYLRETYFMLVGGIIIFTIGWYIVSNGIVIG